MAFKGGLLPHIACGRAAGRAGSILFLRGDALRLHGQADHRDRVLLRQLPQGGRHPRGAAGRTGGAGAIVRHKVCPASQGPDSPGVGHRTSSRTPADACVHGAQGRGHLLQRADVSRFCPWPLVQRLSAPFPRRRPAGGRGTDDAQGHAQGLHATARCAQFTAPVTAFSQKAVRSLGRNAVSHAGQRLGQRAATLTRTCVVL